MRCGKSFAPSLQVQLNTKCCKISDFLLETTSKNSEDSLLLKRSAIIKLYNVFIADTLSRYCSLSRCKRQILFHSKNFDTTMQQPLSDMCLDIIRELSKKYPDIGYLKSAQLSGYRISDISGMDTYHMHRIYGILVSMLTDDSRS